MDQDKSLLAGEIIKHAKSLLVQRRFDDAEEQAARAIGLDPAQVMGFLVRAEARRMQQKHDGALEDAAEVIRLDPRRAAPYVIRAEILKRRCQFRLAIDQATTAIRLDPNNAAAYANRAECRRCVGDQAGAFEDEQELFRIDPTRHAAPARPTGPAPSTTAQAPVDGEAPTRRRPPGAYDDVFADGNSPDRSLKSKVLMDADEAAELLAAASGYRPGIEPLRRERFSSRRSRARRSLPIAALVGGLALAVLGYLMGMGARRGGEPAAQPGPREVLAPAVGEEAQAIVRLEAEPKGPRLAPEIVRLDELNSPGWDGEPWVSGDGLTIYWAAPMPKGNGLGIWSATRRDADLPFEGKRWICPGQCPTVRDDGLEMYFIDKRDDRSNERGIYVASRPSTESRFGQPREVPELDSLQGVWAPSLSRDRLKLLFVRTNPQRKVPEIVVSERTTISYSWRDPIPLPIIPPAGFDGKLDYPSLTADGLRLFCSLDREVDGKPRTRLMVWTRKSIDMPFRSHNFIAVRGEGEIEGWCPRLDEGSGTLYYASLSRDKKDYVNLSCVKNYGDPVPQRGQDTPEPTHGPAVGDASRPHVVETNPPTGATDVDPNLTEMTVTFSKPMRNGCWACCASNRGTVVPSNGQPRFDADRKTFRLPVKLKPGVTYAVNLNLDPQFLTFMDEQKRPSYPYLLVFKTRRNPTR